MIERTGAMGPVLGFAGLVTACAALLATVAAVTGPRIEDNRARQASAALSELLGREVNAADVAWQDGHAVLQDGRVLLRGSAAGYAGDIRWLAAAAHDAEPVLGAVRIVAHQETPGIADFLDRPNRGWLAALSGLNAAALAEVDTLSGATITTRALRRDLAAALARVAAEPAAEASP